MSPSMLQQRTAVLTTSEGNFTTRSDLPVPRSSSGSVLVRVHAVALNPADHKMAKSVAHGGLISGNDFAGEVIAVGSDVANGNARSWKVGDRVCGGILGCNITHPESGAFADMIEADPVTLIQLPSDWSWRGGAALGGCCNGAVGLALFRELGLEFPLSDELGALKTKDLPISARLVLVYGASTACGTVALQLLRLAGYIPLAVCSSNNFPLAKSYGAEQCFDYHDIDSGKQINSFAKGGLKFALDCITTAQSASICYAAIGRGGGRYVGLGPVPTEIISTRKAVKATWVNGPALTGEAVQLGGGLTFDADPEAREFAHRWYDRMEQLVSRKLLKPHPVRLVSEYSAWTENVIHGLEDLKHGTVSGEKLVVDVQA